jgi:hypothetical protein
MPLLTIEGRCINEHFAEIQTGIRVISSKKVSPKDQTSGDPLFTQKSSSSSPKSWRIISGAKY